VTGQPRSRPDSVETGHLADAAIREASHRSRKGGVHDAAVIDSLAELSGNQVVINIRESLRAD
jgi:hypothetical protein